MIITGKFDIKYFRACWTRIKMWQNSIFASKTAVEFTKFRLLLITGFKRGFLGGSCSRHFCDICHIFPPRNSHGFQRYCPNTAKMSAAAAISAWFPRALWSRGKPRNPAEVSRVLPRISTEMVPYGTILAIMWTGWKVLLICWLIPGHTKPAFVLSCWEDERAVVVQLWDILASYWRRDISATVRRKKKSEKIWQISQKCRLQLLQGTPFETCY